jgi:tRNA modification GTPase
VTAPDRRTIFAPATPAGRSGIAVIRLSGPDSGRALAALSGNSSVEPRLATLRALREPSDGTLLDRAIVLWFPGPRSFTGEDMAELHLHGGRAVLRGTLEALGRMPALRPAEPGEFTRRAFLSGKLDLTEAEGIADLVAAETEAQRLQALRQLDGTLGRLCEGWRSRLLDALAAAEAALDFPDEGLPRDLMARSAEAVGAVRREIASVLAEGRHGERLREGLRVAIVGPVNAGKSTLLNALARRDAAIVSDQPGTTRDVIEVQLDLDGWPVTVADTAGLRDPMDSIEAEGIARSRRQAEQADLVLLLRDGSGASWTAPNWLAPLRVIAVATKSDRGGMVLPGELAISALHGDGLNALLESIRATAETLLAGSGTPALTRVRHRVALEDAESALARLEATTLPDLAAEELRLAVRAIGRITGRVDVDDVLDRLFGAFCIGK